MEVWLVRHAEDRAASEGRYGDESLSARGERQAVALGRALRPVPFGRCLCSPLERARQTAELALGARGVPLQLEPCLAEGDVGELSGLAFATVRERFPDDLRLGTSVVARLRAAGRTAPGGETREQLLLRVGRSRELVESCLATEAAPVLVVSHGGLLNYLLQQLLSIPIRDEVPFGFDHCGAVRLLRYREAPAFGPFSMLRFAPPGVEN